MNYELKRADGKVVTWNGDDGEDAARRYVDARRVALGGAEAAFDAHYANGGTGTADDVWKRIARRHGVVGESLDACAIVASRVADEHRHGIFVLGRGTIIG